jgi:hypothetical protein
MNDDWVTAHEAAEALGLKYHTLLSRVRRKRIKGIKRGWAVFIHKDELPSVAGASNVNRNKTLA